MAADEPGTVVVTVVARTDVAWQPPPDPPVTLSFTAGRDAVSTAGAGPARLARFGPTDGDGAAWPLGRPPLPPHRLTASAYRCTTGQVTVRVMPSTSWTRDTTIFPRSSTVSASARAMTS